MEENSVKSRILDYIRAKGMSQKKFEQASGLSNGYLNSLGHANVTMTMRRYASILEQDVIADFERLDGLID